MLATSREPLDIPGEVVYRVPTLYAPDPTLVADLEELAQSDAVRLFTNAPPLLRQVLPSAQMPCLWQPISAAGWTASPWRLSWLRRAWMSSASRRSPTAWTTAFAC
jgi:hypothetical protein